MEKATARLGGQRSEEGNCLDTANGDMSDDGVGDAILAVSNVR